jgi:hypothetical protein
LQKILKIYLFTVSVFTLLSFLGLVAIIYFLDPTVGTMHKLLFYLDFGVFTFMLFILIGYSIRKKFGQRELQIIHFRTSLRQALWFSLLITVSLFLFSNNLFSIVNTILLIIVLIFLESFFISRQEKQDN